MIELTHRRRNRGGGGRALETLLIFIHAAQIAAIAVYIMFGPPKMELLPICLCNYKLVLSNKVTAAVLSIYLTKAAETIHM